MHLMKRPISLDSGDVSSGHSRVAKVQSLLESSGDPTLRLIRCEERAGELVLRGWVPAYSAKQMAKRILSEDQDVGIFLDEIDTPAYIPGTSYPIRGDTKPSGHPDQVEPMKHNLSTKSG